MREQQANRLKADQEEVAAHMSAVQDAVIGSLTAAHERYGLMGRLIEELLAHHREAPVEQNGNSGRAPERIPPRPPEEPEFRNKS
ncbi:hypothetical protein ACIBP6_16575 [Nonomuraea terrae]|uniref:hypothetical protein n=1 Tax=Nonomuraea terrae TaxID=2530383 RepID=UPI003794E36E